jgi:hypothetical protein
MKLIIPFFLFLFLALSSCGGGFLSSQGEPVLLPTPYTGSMTANTDFFTENGFSTEGAASPQETARFHLSLTAEQDFPGAPTGEFLTPLFDPVGLSAGMVTVDFGKARLQVMGKATVFTVPFTITLNDGVSTARAEDMQIIYFIASSDEVAPFPPPPPNTTPLISTGVGWGIVSEGTGIFANANTDGCSISYRFLTEFQFFPDGSFKPFATNHCECVVNCP